MVTVGVARRPRARGHGARAATSQVAVVKLNKRGTACTVGATPLTNPEFDVPTTVASYRGSLYLPNARFGTPPEGTEYSINRIDR